MTTYAGHPGGVASNIWRPLPGLVQRVLKLFLISNEEGAKTPLYCATAPDLATATGRYYTMPGGSCNPLADDPVLATELWREVSGLSRRQRERANRGVEGASVDRGGSHPPGVGTGWERGGGAGRGHRIGRRGGGNHVATGIDLERIGASAWRGTGSAR